MMGEDDVHNRSGGEVQASTVAGDVLHLERPRHRHAHTPWREKDRWSMVTSMGAEMHHGKPDLHHWWPVTRTSPAVIIGADMHHGGLDVHLRWLVTKTREK